MSFELLDANIDEILDNLNTLGYNIGFKIESDKLATLLNGLYGDCPMGGDTTNDCEGCIYSGDYHFFNGDCVLRSDPTVKL